VFKRSHISNPETWTYKRNLEQMRAILGLLQEKIKGTCYENADPEQLVFYVKGTGDLLGNEIKDLNTVRDTVNFILFRKEGNLITAETDGKLYISDFEFWRQKRADKEVSQS
jgi:hypothetical protein